MGKRAVEKTEEEILAEALAAKKAAKKAKKAAAAVAEAEAEEEDPEAAALAAKKAAKKAKKAAAAAAEAEVEEEDPEAAALAAKKAAKKAKKAAAAVAAAAQEAEEAEEEEPAAKKKKTEDAPAPKKKEEPAPAAAAEDEEFKDETYKCIDCSADWVDTSDDQQFRWDKGFAETPKRCKDCRWAKKIRMEGGDPTAKGKSKGKGNKELEIFIGGLPFSTTEDVLRKDFEECGTINNFKMPYNDEGNCRGIAFIEYADKESVEKALKFNDTEYGGRHIQVKMCGDDKGKGKGKDGKGKGKGKDDKGKGKGKGKKGKAPSESFAKSSGCMVAGTGEKKTFADSDSE